MSSDNRRTTTFGGVAAAGLLVALILTFAFTPAFAQSPLPAVPAVTAPVPGFLAAETARDYRNLARYPEHCRPVADGAPDPIRVDRTPAPHSLPSPDGPLLTVWADEVSFQHPAPVDLFVAIGEARWGGYAGWSVTGEVVTAAGEVIGTVRYENDGRAPDLRARDNVYSARFELPPERVPELAESFLVRVRAEGPQGELSRIAGGFLYSNPKAHLTGRYRDRQENGDLVISAELEVAEAGRFHLAATIATVDGTPVGWAQTAFELAAGRQWVDLPFYGLMFTERGTGGPFRLSSVALATTSAMPNALSALAEDAHVTRGYPLEQFTSRPFGDPTLLEAARRLELEAAASRARAVEE